MAIAQPDPHQVLLRVHACGVCRTDLHIVDGELTEPKAHVVPGHEIVGTVQAIGHQVTTLQLGDRIGVPWLGWTCGECVYCRSNRENLCDSARFTGYQIDGGYAEYAVADARYCFKIPPSYGDADAAPLLCAGLIGYRALRTAGTKMSRSLRFWSCCPYRDPDRTLSREGGVRLHKTRGQRRGKHLLSTTARSGQVARTFVPLRNSMPQFCSRQSARWFRRRSRRLPKAEIIVCAGIHISDIPAFPYRLLWGQRAICSVANLTRRDGNEFFEMAERAGVRTTITCYKLEEANDALRDLRAGKLEGAAVLVP